MIGVARHLWGDLVRVMGGSLYVRGLSSADIGKARAIRRYIRG